MVTLETNGISNHQSDMGGMTKLLATGFNAHKQLSPSEDDVKAFELILESRSSNEPRILFAGWSNTVVICGNILFSLGHEQMEPSADEVNETLRGGFGDHEGMLGCLGRDGQLYLVKDSVASEKGPELVKAGTEDSPLIGNMCYAGNGKVVVTFKQAPNGNLCHIAEFTSFESFQKWFGDPSGEGNYPENHHMLPGRPKQLLANTGTFILLMETGEVYTWGDNRYESIARATSGDGSAPADKPGVVEALGGLQISKVATNGWISAAMSEDGALYVWGSTTSAAAGKIECLEAANSEKVALVEISDTDNDPLDVLDVAVGNNHIAAVTEVGRLFVVGDNRNGQLGLGSSEDIATSWQEAPAVSKVRRVFCGPKSTFVVCED